LRAERRRRWPRVRRRVSRKKGVARGARGVFKFLGALDWALIAPDI
jgi:hypothetical protein